MVVVRLVPWLATVAYMAGGAYRNTRAHGGFVSTVGLGLLLSLMGFVVFQAWTGRLGQVRFTRTAVLVYGVSLAMLVAQAVIAYRSFS